MSRFVYGWGNWRRRLAFPDGTDHFAMRWCRPRAVVVRSADRWWLAWNTYPGVLIGLAIGLPRIGRRPGYPMLSILWGAPGHASRSQSR